MVTIYLISGLVLLKFDFLSFGSGRTVPFDYRVILVTVLAIIDFEVFQFLARNALVKSDMDFMANFGVSTTPIMTSFLLYSLLLTSLPSLLIFSMISFFSTPSVPPYATVLFSLFILFISIFGFILRLFGRIRETYVLLVMIAALGLLGIAKFPLAISNISGKYWQFSLIGVLAILVVAFAILWKFILSRDDTSLRFRTVPAEHTVKHPINFSRWSKRNPLLRFSTTMTFAASRGNIGARRSGYGRLAITGIVLLASVIFVLLIIFTFYFPSIGPSISVTVISYYIVFMSFLLFYSIINERIWIGWNTVEPHNAVRSYVSGKLIMLSFIALPVLIFLIYAYLTHLLILPSESLVFLISIPLLLYFPFFFYATILNLNVIKAQSRTFGGGLSEGTFFIFLPLIIAYLVLSIV
ncbi:MAG: hypothetical protein QXN26_02620, partial [Thermoplasmataceae archaeon]